MRFRVPKEDLERVIRKLYAFGIGPYHAARMTGYSHTQLWNYANDWGLKVGTERDLTAWLQSLLPEDLQADLRRIRMRSDVAHARATNRVTQSQAREQHLIAADGE
jgi:hypothetical protein